ncbi:tyrosine-protein phosphatase [Desulfovibrio aminophilus]|uniref:tyrosine-protein phosphatase n=1 Tax=Desulfovibrio aminophilus TaxID=81425 RepID=UPI000688D02E|nr:tyrosine-protein phosphatase [Desulfovibrio aminophilus]
MTQSRIRSWARGLAAILAVLLFLGALFLAVRGWNNIHVVEEGRIYRSAQLDPETLGRFIEKHGIRSILNLRGRHPDSHWYQQETAVAREHGVVLYDRKLSALEPVAPGTLDEIMDCVDRTPKPLLIHCEGGADRTGLVVSAWLFASRHLPASDAAGQLSLRYGHFPWLWSDTDAMDHSYWDYVAARGGITTQAERP